MSVASVLTRNDGNAPPANGRVRQWLSRAGLGEYRDAFARTAEREFTALGMVDFQNFGVVDVAHKQTLFRLIKNLQNAEGAVCESDDAELPSRVKHMALVDVHAAEHDELLLSPLLRPNTSATQKSPFAPSPADDKEANETKHETTLPDDKRADSPLEQLRRLSRERHGAVGQAAANAGETLNDARFSRNESVSEDANKSASSRESASPPDPAKTPFVASPSVFSNHAERLVDANPHLPLAPLPADQPRIRVVVRKRPLNAKERAREEEDVVTVDRRSSAETTSCETRASCVTVWEPKTKVDLTQYTEEHAFNFDDVFDPEASNDEVYRATIAPLVGTTFDKCKVTCFAYGQTGSGKTYTMNPLPIRAAGEILGELERRRRTSEAATADGSSLRLHVSFFEIYGGKVYDLLNGRARLVIREDARAQMCVVGLKEFEVADVGLVEQLIAHGTAARCVGSTGANAESSRSHAIMQFVLKKSAADESGSESGPARRVPASVVAQRLKTKAGANHETIHGKFSFIDLAGSERGADTSENDRQTRLEGAEINKSLLALKECIRALDRGNGHVPFRGSKLTEVLRDSFMGNSRTVMIANVSPASGSCEHTLNTLRYAYRVKELRDDAKSSTDVSTKKKDATRFAADGVTPVGPPPPNERTERTTNEQRAAVEKTEKTSGGSGGSASAFDPRAAARAAAARVRDATRRSADAEAERLAEKKRGAAAFLTKGGGGGGGGGLGYSAGGLLSPRGRKERPKSAMPLHGARGIASARAAGATGAKSVSGSPTKDADGRRTAGVGAKARARPQTAQTRSGVSGVSGSRSGSGTRRAQEPRSARRAHGPARYGVRPRRGARRAREEAVRGSAGFDAGDDGWRMAETSSADHPIDRANARDERRAWVTTHRPSGSQNAVPATTKTLRPLRGSALAAAKARAHLAGGPPADQAEMVAAHDDLINVILEEEEAVIAAHRAQIENAMALVKREMALLAEVDKPGSAIDAYVERLAEVLEQKQKGVESLRDAVRAFQTHLKEEEVLSKAVGLH
jgi:kinesin family protein 2/24